MVNSIQLLIKSEKEVRFAFGEGDGGCQEEGEDEFHLNWMSCDDFSLAGML